MLAATAATHWFHVNLFKILNENFLKNFLKKLFEKNEKYNKKMNILKKIISALGKVGLQFRGAL